MQEPMDSIDEAISPQCPSCGSFEFDTQECAKCGFSYHKPLNHNNVNCDIADMAQQFNESQQDLEEW